eukprot:TRINITY_DN78888_c0_g1_i1.p2 TRINITY_DN78888_c0_g1~~TRINITY_DN78888_c0_g1_i1.p2  ORF type:complete len:255 (-),score=121.83 TRINITY_DN78888_c0_g1_i1:13-777(-)
MSRKHFVKKQHNNIDALRCEAAGLEALRQATKSSSEPLLHVPEVFDVGDDELRLEWIDDCVATAQHMRKLGRGLALMHQQKQKQYGWSDDNYIGLNPQKNGFSDDWGRFFVDKRLRFQVSLIEDDDMRAPFEAALDEHGDALCAFLNKHCTHASLLHGDLWAGNVMFDASGRVWLIDPAVYCGDREADLAMTEMFGGFRREFYEAYDAVLPRTSAYATKKQIYNLYHYLNHLNLFGRGYLGACKRAFALISSGI